MFLHKSYDTLKKRVVGSSPALESKFYNEKTYDPRKSHICDILIVFF